MRIVGLGIGKNIILIKETVAMGLLVVARRLAAYPEWLHSNSQAGTVTQ